MAADDRSFSAVYAIKQRLEALESEKSELLAESTRLQRNQDAVAEPRAPSAATGSVNAASDAAAKIKLFRSLFRGRDEVFPCRWQNANSGKSGYSPVCRNEWVRGICEKPLVKCGECLHQAFVPVTDDVIRSHLQGTDRASTNSLHRLHPTKRDVMIYDYVDTREPMLLSMSMKRRTGYRVLGYTEVSVEEAPSRA